MNSVLRAPADRSPTRDAMAQVFALKGHDDRALLVAGILALLLHGAAAPFTLISRAHARAPFVPPVELAFEEIAEPLPPPLPPPPEPPSESAPTHPEVPAQAHAVAAAAQASAVLTAEPDEATESDDAIVTGEAQVFSGGTTEQQGASAVAAEETLARAKATAAPPGPPAIDHARPAYCSLDVDWGCNYPDDAETDEAVVVAKLFVRSNGLVEHVEVVSAPKGSFQREAIRCAMHQRCRSARDAAGTDVYGETNPIRIRFTR